MAATHLKKSIGRSPLRLGFFLVALLLASFAVVQSAKADGLVFGIKLTNKEYKLPTHFKGNTTGRCAGGEEVEVGGLLQVEFEKRNGDVVPKTDDVNGNKLLPKDASKAVGGEGKMSHRPYKVDKVQVEKIFGLHPATNVSEGGGSLRLRIFFVGKPNGVNTAQGDISPGKVFTFSVIYPEVVYTWNKQHEVTGVVYLRSSVKPDCP